MIFILYRIKSEMSNLSYTNIKILSRKLISKPLGKLILIFSLLLAVAYYVLERSPFNNPPPLYNPNPWVTGYLPAYHHNEYEISFMTAQDYQMLTHIAHASAIPREDGSLDTDTNTYHLEQRQIAVKTAKQQKLPILLTITGSYDQFSPSIAPDKRATFIANILTLLDGDGYDGVDVDMEPITRNEDQPNPDYLAFITDLHAALQKRTSQKLQRAPLLTTAVSYYDRLLVAKVADKFDQINIMTYDMAQPYEGWVTWFDSALSNGGMLFPGLSNPLPSVELWVNAFLQAGIPRRKLGIGISLDVACWKGGDGTSTGGVTAPRQAWIKPPTYAKKSYADMTRAGLIPAQLQWDEVAHMAWFGMDNPGSTNDQFCNFNDARAIADKIDFVKTQGLGGLIIWELGLDQRDDLPKDQQRPLRHSIGEALKK